MSRFILAVLSALFCSAGALAQPGPHSQGVTITLPPGVPASGGTFTGPVVMNSSALQTALSIVQTGTGATAGPVPNGAFAYNLINITSDTIDPSSAPAGSQNAIGLDIGMTTGGAGTKGTHIPLAASINVNATPTTAGNYVGGWFFTNISAQLGGGLGTEAGNAYGSNPQVFATSAATRMVSVVGEEIDVSTKAAPLARFGLNIVNLTTGNIQGSGRDAAIAIGSADAAGAFKYGFNLTNFNGTFPILSTGTILGSDVSGAVANGIDFSNITCSSFCYASAGLTDNGTGTVQVKSASGAASLEIDSATANTAFLNMKVNNVLKWFHGTNSGGGWTLFDQTNSANAINVSAAGAATFGEAAKLTTVTGSTIVLANVTTGTNADFLCMAAGNVVTLQTSACTISSLRFKDVLGPLDTDRMVTDIMALHPLAFKMKTPAEPNADPNYALPQIGLTAENVAAVDTRLAIYEDDMKTPKSYRQEGVIAALVVTAQRQQWEIRTLGVAVVLLMFWCAALTIAVRRQSIQ